MDSSKKCNIIEHCRTDRCSFVGIILIVLATIMTIVTFSGLGILGMFVVGLVMCCHKHLGCRCKCCADVCETEECSVTDKEVKKSTKKSAS